ncbi:hypothetical protein ARY01_14290 [Listeria monocytogenes]|uniref:Uncharacterized protein n=1 Tax=Listeria marthii FSL S4-120 TaxID=702457 RepID=A0ABN0BV23_9LIST|nr:hypothetical protein [Listeria monocytogenes]EFR86866.1 conserved hypothetical protein [Listeria marthii FSL S4-120]EAC7308616.1 hypothetical protein [Listeria monocytogenes]EAD2638464.1 hypothetical protein [Listeria monocytogenes]EGS3237005.1 hypothetical protein [Listeria monocytogenes]
MRLLQIEQLQALSQKFFLAKKKTGIIFENKRANLITVPTNNDLGGAFLVLTDDVPKKSHLPLIKHHSNYL